MNLNELNLIEEDAPDVEVTENLPSQMGSFVPALQPGTYIFKLPTKDVLENCFETRDTIEDGKSVRVVDAVFQGPAKLGAGAHGSFETKISSARYPRGKDKILVSDMTYLLQALGHQGSVKGHLGQAQALITHAGETFAAEVSWYAKCDKNKEVYKMDAEGKSKKVEGSKGCGKTYAPEGYTNKKTNVQTYEIPRDPETGALDNRFECSCGAIVRAFTSLRNFSKIK